MKLTKTIKIKQKDKTIEINIKQDGEAKWNSKDFKKGFDYLLDNIIAMLLEKECHYSEIESE